MTEDNEAPLAPEARDLIRTAHQTTHIGKQLEAAGGDLYIDGGDATQVADALNFIFTDLRVLEALVVRLAVEVDRFRAG